MASDRRTLYYPRWKAGLQVVFDGFGVDSANLNKPIKVGVDGDLTPKTMQVHLNGYKEADTFGLEFDARRLPFTPEVIRGGEATLWLYHLSNTDDAGPQLTSANSRMRGLFDNAQFRGGDGGRWFSIDGRDYTALLIDKQWTQLSGQRGRVPVGHDLEETVRGLVDEAVKRKTTDAFGNELTSTTLRVKFHGDAEDPLIRSVSKGVTQRQVTQKPPIVGHGHARTHRAGLPVRTGRTYWDVIYMLCLKHGFICYVRGDQLIIAKPQTLTREQGNRLYRMVLGRNLKSLVIERHMAKEAVPQIVAVSYDPRTAKTLEARFPDKATEKITGVNTVKEEIRFVEAGYGITDMALLREVAKTYYYHVARGEAKIRWSTKDLTDLSEEEKDLVDLTPGDPVTIGFNDFNDADFREMTIAQRERFLDQLGYEAQVASVLATQFDRLPKDAYYTKTASFSCDLENGIEIACDSVNFISVRRDGAGLPTTPVPAFTFNNPKAKGRSVARRGPLRAH